MPTQEQIIAYVQSRMSAEDRTAFEAAMRQDDDLRAEVAAMVGVREVFKQDAANQGQAVPKDGWQRLSERIDKEGTGAPFVPAAKPANDNRFWSMSVLQVAAIALFSILGWQALQSTMSFFDGTGYHTASADGTWPALQIAFSATAPLGEVSALLLDLEGWVIEGPSALGLYLIAFEDAEARENAFSVLSANSTLIDSVLRN